jgi:hypothetical protein
MRVSLCMGPGEAYVVMLKTFNQVYPAAIERLTFDSD